MERPELICITIQQYFTRNHSGWSVSWQRDEAQRSVVFTLSRVDGRTITHALSSLEAHTVRHASLLADAILDVLRRVIV